MVSNAAVYFILSYGVLREDFRSWIGGFTLLLAIFYGSQAYFILRRSNTLNTRLGYFALSIALVFLSIAIPIQFGDKAWTTVALAAEAVALMWLSFRLQMPLLRNFSYGVFVLMAVRLLFFDTSINIRFHQPILNERFLAFLAGILATYLLAYLLWREKETMKEWATPASTFLVAANFLTIWVLSFEVWDFFNTQLSMSAPGARTGLENAQNLSLTALWAFYAVVLLVVGIAKHWRPVRLWGLALLIIPIVKVFAYDVWALETIYRIVSFVGLGILLLVSAYLYQRHRKAIRGLIVDK